MKALEINVDSAIVMIANTEDTQIQLNQMIFKSFDTALANKIIDNCKFISIDSSKLGVQVNSIKLSKQDKEELRICIKSVYGNDINITSLPSLKAVKTELEAIKPVTISINSTWLKIRNDLFECFPHKLSEHVIKAWFDKLDANEDLVSKKLILIGSSFYIGHIVSNFGEELEYVAMKNKIKIELRYKNNDYPEIVYPFKQMSEAKLKQLISKKY
tara:strand:+ start:1068 stop:1712 length:645 start_codon:yes stop_codon:yes gene_type:complete